MLWKVSVTSFNKRLLWLHWPEATNDCWETFNYLLSVLTSFSNNNFLCPVIEVSGNHAVLQNAPFWKSSLRVMSETQLTRLTDNTAGSAGPARWEHLCVGLLFPSKRWDGPTSHSISNWVRNFVFLPEVVNRGLNATEFIWMINSFRWSAGLKKKKKIWKLRNVKYENFVMWMVCSKKK